MVGHSYWDGYLFVLTEEDTHEPDTLSTSDTHQK